VKRQHRMHKEFDLITESDGTLDSLIAELQRVQKIAQNLGFGNLDLRETEDGEWQVTGSRDETSTERQTRIAKEKDVRATALARQKKAQHDDLARQLKKLSLEEMQQILTEAGK